jgi:hypothetical protein
MSQDSDDNKKLIWQNDVFLWHVTFKDFLANYLCRENQLNLKSSITTD